MAGSSGMTIEETCIQITEISTFTAVSVCVCVRACVRACGRACVCARLDAAGVCNFMHRKCLCIQSS